ncbi:hypothetical protein JZ751_025480 [Albula glossodonta]|uniref:Tetraspanin n=1 Tax=Albula glossodonta TaxID=121402 RepID=A0A8T2NLZ0_9TELE|nr:hypothetical protein JZ751_025480 [Albula glossodonta]
MTSPSRRLQTKPLTGVILLAVGVWGKVSLEAYFSLALDKSTNAPYVLIGTGAFIVIFGLFGCFATCRGSPWMLKLYAMFLALVFLAELVAGISGFLFRHEIKAILNNTYSNAIEHFDGASPQSQAVDTIQRTLECCGSESYKDWGKTDYFKTNGIPASCCKKANTCPPDDLKDMEKAADEVYPKGCFSQVTAKMEANLGIIAGISFGIAFFQLIGVFLACCLSRYITNNQYEMNTESTRSRTEAT